MHSKAVNRQILYVRRPEGKVGQEHFQMRESAIPVPQSGQALVRVRAVSISPAQRIWMGRPTYRSQLVTGEVMAAFSIGDVIESRVPSLQLGDILEGEFGWQEYAVVEPATVRQRDPSLPLEHLLGVLNLTGLTAYFGLLEVGRPLPGETVVISAAAGAVGCIAVQIAKLAGCRVVAVAGGAEKCRWLTEVLGADQAVDYKAGNMAAALQAACPGGIDVYFDNTGGEILEAVLSLMNLNGRIACCGAVSQYDQADAKRGGPSGLPETLIVKRIRMQGFIVMDFNIRWNVAEATMLKWMRSGLLQAPVHVVKGLENAPQALIDLLDGKNLGKMLVVLD